MTKAMKVVKKKTSSQVEETVESVTSVKTKGEVDKEEDMLVSAAM